MSIYRADLELERIDCLKAVPTEKKRSGKWLCEQLNVNPLTISELCTDSSQPDIEKFIKISKLLEIEMEDLLNKRYVEYAKV